ncbi:MAG: flavin reductase, partial [Bacteroidales bacterium]|nr:flavin reductase [Bacteroidales bacterium]
MSKVSFKPGTMIYPLPAVMVSCGETPEEYNIITIGWVGTICSEPPMCYISIRKSRLSHEIISKTKSFVIN